MGYQVPYITLTFSGDMPLKIQTLRPNQNGLPDCDMDEWQSSDGILGNQYAMVDEQVKDDDITYIETYDHEFGDNEVYQVFSKPLLSLPAGSIINWVRVNAYYKYSFNTLGIEPDYLKMALHPEYGWQPDWSYIFGGGGGWINLIMSLNSCTNMYSSPSIELSDNMWGRYYYNHKYWGDDYFELDNKYGYISITYNDNPDTSNPWSISEVDSMQFGVKGLSGEAIGIRAIGYDAMDTSPDIFPNSDVSVTSWSKVGSVYTNYYNYLYIVDSNYIESQTLNTPCLFGFNSSDWATYENWDSSNLIGISLEAYISGDFNHDNTIHFVRVHDGVKDILNTVNITTGLPNWQHVTYDFQTNASWHDLDPAHNSYGIEIHAVHSGGKIAITRFNIYSLTVESRISSLRVTQEYIDVAYHELAPTPCKLPKPEWNGIQVDQDIDTLGLNFWSGNRAVFAEGRSSKRTILSGIMWDGCTDGTTTCEQLIACIRSLGKLQQPITIGGLRYNDLNVEYNMISFSWVQIQEKPNTYKWNLELEFCD